jgi:hypothetical protein
MVVDSQKVMYLPGTIHANANVNLIPLKHLSPGLINQSSVRLNTDRELSDVAQHIAGSPAPSIEAPRADQAGLAAVKPQEQ